MTKMKWMLASPGCRLLTWREDGWPRRKNSAIWSLEWRVAVVSDSGLSWYLWESGFRLGRRCGSVSEQQKAVSCLQRRPIGGYLDDFSLVLPLSVATYLGKELPSSLPPSRALFSTRSCFRCFNLCLNFLLCPFKPRRFRGSLEKYTEGGAWRPAERLSFKRLAASVVDNQSTLERRGFF